VATQFSGIECELVISLKLKAEFEFSSDPFVVKVGPYHGQRVDPAQQAVVTASGLNFLEARAERGSFRVFGISSEQAEGDVWLVQPSSGRVSRLVRRGPSVNNSILYTERCDQFCVMCSQPPRDSVDGWRLPLLEQAVLLADRDARLGITGGEPTLYTEKLCSLLESVCSKRPDLSLHILSNGQHFHKFDQQRLKAALSSKQVTWGIPLYSREAGLHDEIVDKEGAYLQLLENLGILAGAGGFIELRTVLMAKNVLELPELAKFVSTRLRFIGYWAIMALESAGFAKANMRGLFFDHSLAPFPLDEAALLAVASGIQVRLFNFPNCTLPKRLRPLAVQSISDWKNKYLRECSGCAEKGACAGFFEWYKEPWQWSGVRAITNEQPKENF